MVYGRGNISFLDHAEFSSITNSLLQIANDFETEDDFNTRHRLAGLVLERLIYSDNVLIELRNETGDDSESILVVHPNFNPEEGSSMTNFSGSPTKNKRNFDKNL